MRDPPRLRFIATGNTYRHREELCSLAWHWDQARGAWVNENEDTADDMCIAAVIALPGVKVTCEGPVEASQ